jgi:hypothetical protein
MLAGDEEADAATDHCVAPASVVRESIQIRSRCDALVCVCASATPWPKSGIYCALVVCRHGCNMAK